MDALRNVQDVYEKLGAEDPFWAVLSSPEYRRDRADESQFFATGRKQIAQQLADIEAAGITLGRERALDFGAGLGRLTNPLGEQFGEAIGVDISHTMVTNAERLKRSDRCRFVVNTLDDLSLFPDEHFDFVYSDITLQHIPWPASGHYIAEFLRVVKKDGLIVCLVPDGVYRAEGSIHDRLARFYRERVRPFYKRLRGKPPVQIHPIAERRVEELAAAHGGMILRTDVPPKFRQSRRRFKPQFYWICRKDGPLAEAQRDLSTAA